MGTTTGYTTQNDSSTGRGGSSGSGGMPVLNTPQMTPALAFDKIRERLSAIEIKLSDMEKNPELSKDDLLELRTILEMLAFVRLSGQPFQQFGDDIFLSFAISQNEVGIYPAVRVCDKFQMGIDDGIRESCSQTFSDISSYHF